MDNMYIVAYVYWFCTGKWYVDQLKVMNSAFEAFLVAVPKPWSFLTISFGNDY